ncbi:MAG: Dabb family protein [Mycobacterium sp.]
MIRHVVLFRWKPDFPTEDRENWLSAVRRLPEQIEVLRALDAGPDVLGAQRSWDTAIVADFDTVGDIAVYTDHPAHLPLIEVSAAGADAVASVDFEIETSGGTTP